MVSEGLPFLNFFNSFLSCFLTIQLDDVFYVVQMTIRFHLLLEKKIPSLFTFMTIAPHYDSYYNMPIYIVCYLHTKRTTIWCHRAAEVCLGYALLQNKRLLPRNFGYKALLCHVCSAINNSRQINGASVKLMLFLLILVPQSM